MFGSKHISKIFKYLFKQDILSRYWSVQVKANSNDQDIKIFLTSEYLKSVLQITAFLSLNINYSRNFEQINKMLENN